MVFGTRENHEGRFLLENGLDGYIFWVLVVMGGLDLAAWGALVAQPLVESGPADD